MTVLIAMGGTATLVWVLRRHVYHTPPVLPQLWAALCTHGPRLIAELEVWLRSLGGPSTATVVVVPAPAAEPAALPERHLGEAVRTLLAPSAPEPERADEWGFPGPPC